MPQKKDISNDIEISRLLLMKAIYWLTMNGIYYRRLMQKNSL